MHWTYLRWTIMRNGFDSGTSRDYKTNNATCQDFENKKGARIFVNVSSEFW